MSHGNGSGSRRPVGRSASACRAPRARLLDADAGIAAELRQACDLDRAGPSAAPDRDRLERDLRLQQPISASSRTHAASRCARAQPRVAHAAARRGRGHRRPSGQPRAVGQRQVRLVRSAARCPRRRPRDVRERRRGRPDLLDHGARRALPAAASRARPRQVRARVESAPASRRSSSRWPTPQRASASSSIGSPSAISSSSLRSRTPETLAQEGAHRPLDERDQLLERDQASVGSRCERLGQERRRRRGAGQRTLARPPARRPRSSSRRGTGRVRSSADEVALVERLQRDGGSRSGPLLVVSRPLARHVLWRRSRRAAHRPEPPVAAARWCARRCRCR